MKYISDLFVDKMNPDSFLSGLYNPWLVLLSVLVAIFASGMAMQIAGMASASKSIIHRRVAIATGSIALAGGIWAMHFIGMLAFELCTRVDYAPVATILSIVPALGASWVALHILTYRDITLKDLVTGGVLVGAGIGAMHYSGMFAMQMNAVLHYDPWVFALSIGVAVGLAMLALWVRFGLRKWGRLSAAWNIVASGIVMGVAISSMHYIGMSAARIVGSPTSARQMATGAIFMALAIAFITTTLIVLVVGVNGAMRYRQLFYKLQFNESRLQAIFDTAVDGIITIDSDGFIQSLNRSAECLFDRLSAEVMGRHIGMLIPEFDNSRNVAPFSDNRSLSLASIVGVGQEVTGTRRDGSWMPVRLAIGKVTLPGQSLFVGIVSDISERKKAEEEINFIACHDALTGLPNRMLLQDRFMQAIVQADREGTKIGLLFLDLDNFKTINDTLGHSVGDMLIRHIAAHLRECVRATDTVCRHGGDEFQVVLQSLTDADAVAPILSKIMNRMLSPYEVEGREWHTSVSIGVAIYPDDGHDFDTIMKRADMAMYRAKEAGRSTYRFFDEQMNLDAVEQLKIRNGLRQALERNEFVLHYQPQIDLDNGELIGVEALIRWAHPDFGLIYPGRFIQIAEDSGLIVPIGEWVLREACRQAVEWRRAGRDGLVMAVNLSAVQFKRSDLVQSVAKVLKESGINPALLELELTESILISDTENILTTVGRLKQLGVKLSIDDFGTGYSSLSYLKRFAVDKLKIDQSFVRDLASDGDDAAIVRAIIQMAQGLGLTTIAEGIENEQTMSHLKIFGCNEGQGYHIARPMPAVDFTAYIHGAMAVAESIKG